MCSREDDPTQHDGDRRTGVRDRRAEHVMGPLTRRIAERNEREERLARIAAVYPAAAAEARLAGHRSNDPYISGAALARNDALWSCDDCGRRDGTHDPEVEH